MSSEPNLLGRLAVHYKLLTTEQLAETTQLQARQAKPVPIGEIWIQAGWMSRPQLEKLLQVQREVVAKQAASAPAAAAAAAPAAAPRAAAAPAKTAAPVGAEALDDAAVGRKVDRVLANAVATRASDIHVLTGERLLLRIDGELRLAGDTRFTAEQLERVVDELLDEPGHERLTKEGQTDFAWTTDGVARFRGNAYRHQSGLGVSLRTISLEVPTLASLELPNTLAKLTNHHQGLVLVTGPSGCGKSSTLAALLRLINEERQDHIVTIEDPIEYLHEPLLSVVNQRQVGRDTGSFARALKAALREDPDVIAIGELRDLETISLALSAAETGHLVLATLTTGGAIRTIERVIGAFPPGQQPQIRTMLSESLRAVVSQRLVRRADGVGRVPALEVMLGTRAVANLIREAKTFQIRSILQTGSSHGMWLLDASLAQLVRDGVVTRDEAVRHAEDPKALPAAGAS